MTRFSSTLVSEALLEELLREPHSDGTGAGESGDESPDFVRFPNLHDRIEASRECPGPAPYGLWSSHPWGGDAA
jgi:hypothetical protein